jgi:hypothetical protein
MGIQLSKIICDFEVVEESGFIEENGELLYEGESISQELDLFDITDWEEVEFCSEDNPENKVYALLVRYQENDSEKEILVFSTQEEFEETYFYYFEKEDDFKEESLLLVA